MKLRRRKNINGFKTDSFKTYLNFINGFLQKKNMKYRLIASDKRYYKG